MKNFVKILIMLFIGILLIILGFFGWFESDITIYFTIMILYILLGIVVIMKDILLSYKHKLKKK